MAILTSKLQHEQLTIPKFNEYWIEAKLELETFIDSSISFLVQRLLALLNEHRVKIDSNPLVTAGIFLDPRMRKSLTEIQQSSAKELITAVFNRIKGEESSPSNIGTTSKEEPPTKFRRFVESLNSQQVVPTESQKSLDSVFNSYDFGNFGQQVSHTTDPTLFWLDQVKRPD